MQGNAKFYWLSYYGVQYAAFAAIDAFRIPDKALPIVIASAIHADNAWATPYIAPMPGKTELAISPITAPNTPSTKAVPPALNIFIAAD